MSLHDFKTLDFEQTQTGEASQGTIGLTILAHPDCRRVGETAALFPAASGGKRHLSRVEPDFGAPSEAAREPLASASRSPSKRLLQGW